MTRPAQPVDGGAPHRDHPTDDPLERIADALERIADALAPAANRQRAVEPEAIPVSDTDRAAARRIARRLGLHVRGGR